MQTGKLDQRVTIEAMTEVNESGSLTKSYADVTTVWAHVISQRGNESFEAARTNTRETIRVKMRFRTDITPESRIRWRDTSYNVKYIDESNRRNGELWLTCEVIDKQ